MCMQYSRIILLYDLQNLHNLSSLGGAFNGIFILWHNFYAPGLKGPPGSSSVSAYKQSAIFKVGVDIQLSNLDCISFMGSSHFTDIKCPWVVVKM